MIENIFEFIEKYVMELEPNVISYPNYKEKTSKDVIEVIYVRFEKELDTDEKVMEIMDEIEFYVEEYFDNFYRPKRFIEKLEEYPKIDKEKIEKLILEEEQRSIEWYEKRHNLITASNVYKVFGSDALKNQLIYEKCMPVKNGQSGVNSLTWGTKYECVSTMIYEKIYNTRILNTGCIIHKDYPFLGASPDGINTEGILIEIKNVVSREITGIPKMEYWIQMQIQMECCDIDYCHFIETKFVEYMDENEYMLDIIPEYKGTIMETVDGKYVVEIYEKEKENELIENEKMSKEDSTNKIIEIDIIKKKKYWKLEKISCVYIERNKNWFEKSVEKIREIWDKIQQEKIDGFAHRKPKRKCLL